MEDAIKRFLSVNYGYGDGSGDDDGYGYGDGSGDDDGYGYGDGSGSGYGDGSGSGYGSGYGSGSGSGDGSGSGSGDGSGYGSGSGSGSGSGDGYIKQFNGQKVYYIDNIPTLITCVHKDRYAKGYIIRRDLTLCPTFVAKVGNSFAHGQTLKEAVADATAKWLDNQPVEQKIERFVAAHPDLDTPYPDLFEWHHILTGSCEQGRKGWCQSHGYKPSDSITIRTFITQTLNDYGGHIIKELAEVYSLDITRL